MKASGKKNKSTPENNKMTAGNRPNLVNQVSEALRQLIVSGELSVGDKLPSEAMLTIRHAVSRTVIREALAALRSDGLIESRQGAGVFVIEPMGAPTEFMSVNPERISSVVEMLELRTAIEVEAAGLAAIRCSPAQEDQIFEALQQFERCLNKREATSGSDCEFHLAIAAATNNPRFAELLELMGSSAIPRQSLQEDMPTVKAPDAYLKQIHQEHAEIANAISRRDEQAARTAMRDHLKGSQQRYRALLRPQ